MTRTLVEVAIAAGQEPEQGGLPESRRDLIERPRLLDRMAQRFDRPLTILRADAGFGKSCLISQAMSDAVSKQRGRDVYLRVPPGGADAAFIVRGFLEHLGVSAPVVTVAGLIDHLWSESPRHVALVLDDLHRIAAGSDAWEMLEDLVEQLPSNGHLVLSGRRRPEMRLSRLLATGAAVELTEPEFVFDAEEFEQFAAARGVPVGGLQDHGWPALLELEAFSGAAGAHDFIAEEILSNMPRDRVRALRRLALGEIIDDGFVAALTDYSGSAASLVEGLPLTSEPAAGQFRLHDIWRELLATQLSPDERATVLRALAAEHLHRADLIGAHSASRRAGDPEGIRAVLRALALDYQMDHPLSVRSEIVASTPASFDDAPEMLIVRADANKVSAPGRAVPAAQAAAAAAEKAGLSELHAHALLRLGELHYRMNDIDELSDVRRSIRELLADGGDGAEAVAIVLNLWELMLDNGATKALDVVGAAALRAYEPLASVEQYYRVTLLCWSGNSEAAWREIEVMREQPRGRVLLRLGGLISQVQWFTGRLADAEREAVTDLIDRIEALGQIQLFVEGAAVVSVYAVAAGDLSTARRLQARAENYRDRMSDRSIGLRMLEVAVATADFLAGDEDLAAARLEEALPASGPFHSLARHLFGHAGALVYALVPRSREFYDGEDIGPDFALSNDVGRAIVALRERCEAGPAAALPWNDLHRLRAWAIEPHLAELAVAATVAGNRDAVAALDSLRHDPRRDLSAVASRYAGHPIGDAASARLQSSPTRPASTLSISVLGKLSLRRGNEPLDDAPELRRQTVRDLLLLLVHRRRIRRSEAMATLWPDKDQKSADANLRAALKHLRSLVEPARAPDDTSPPWYVRSGADDLTLFDADLLHIDADEFSRQIRLGTNADRERRTSAALEHFRRAVDLYGGDYLDAASDSEWAQTHRTALHLDFVVAATRASELLSTSGQPEEARDLAVRAVAAEPFAERGHRALARARALAGDRAGAIRTIDEAVQIIELDGLAPEADTLRLRERLRGSD